MKIVFTGANNWLSQVVRWATNSPASHVMVEFFSPALQADVTVDSDLRGVQLLPAFRTRKDVVAEFTCPEHVEAALPVVTRYLGSRYDFGGLVLISIPVLLWRWFGVRMRHPLRRTKEVKCSELVALLLKRAGLPGTSRWDPENITPGDLLRYCSTSDFFTTVDQGGA